MKSESEILSIVRRQLDNSIGAVGSDAIYDTTDALNYYHGRPYGTEEEGCSRVVTREVLETVEWTMPSLLRIFTSGDRVVLFEAHGDEDEAQAEQETDYVNHVFLKDNPGWSICNDWFRTALVERVGYVKSTWEKKRRSRVTRYDGLSDEQLAMVLEGSPGGTKVYDEVTLLEGETDEYASELGIVRVHNIRVRETTLEGRVRVVTVPREDMRVSKDAMSVCLDDVTLVAHVRDMTASELIELGVPADIVETLPGDRKVDKTRQNINYARQVERGSQRSEFFSTDNSTRLIEIAECYIRMDADEDGIAELRRIVYAGDRILENDEVEEQPFVALCPIPQPFTHVGYGESDLTMDLQLINSALWRGMLDNIRLTNNPERLVVEEDVNIEDFAQSFPGKVKRALNLDSVRELVVPFAAGASIPLLEYLVAIKETRTGVTKQSMGVDAEALSKSTLGAFSLGLNQGNQRIETYARTFAETGFARLFQKIRSLVCRHQDRPRMVKLRGRYVEIDPRDWGDRFDTTAQVGIGTGGQTQTLAQLAALADKQEEHIRNGSPLVRWSNLYNTYARMLEVMGYKDPTRFWVDPNTPEFQTLIARQEEARQAAAREQSEQQERALASTLSIQAAEVERKRLADQESSIVDMFRARTDAEKEANRSAEKRTELEIKGGENVPGALI